MNSTDSSLIRGIEPRIYQQTIFAEIANKNSLVVLPTGLGKTVIIAYLTAFRLSKSPKKKIIITTPTKPLVSQTASMLRDFLAVEPETILDVTGETNPEKRTPLYQKSSIIVITPQTLENDLLNGRINPDRFSVICFDEAHRATGEYAYSRILQDIPKSCQIVGFTATPGNSEEAVREVIANLRSENIVVRYFDSPDVKDYVSIHRPEIVWVDIPNEYSEVIQVLKGEISNLAKTLKEAGLSILGGNIGKREALALQQQVLQLRKEDPSQGAFLVTTANLIRTIHLLDLVETQGFPQALDSIIKWENKKRTKALDAFFESYGIKKVFSLINANPIPHPKLQRLAKILQKAITLPESRIIVFSNYRSSIDFLNSELVEIHNIPCGKFVGQSSVGRSKGMRQKEQIEVLTAFKEGNPPILISTSVGEEGLDVGSCDLVIFYDSVPSVVRSIQRTGRGRKKQSRVVRLITKSTRDASIYYATLNREKRLRDILSHSELILEKTSDEKVTLDQFLKPDTKEDNKLLFNKKSGISILVDNREARSIVPRALKREHGISIKSHHLPAGDYVVSDRTCIERKTTTDFVESLMSPISDNVGENRLFNEITRLSDSFNRPIVIIEGTWDQARAVSEEAIQGALLAIMIGFRIPIIFTNNPIETAQTITQIARREQKTRKKPLLTTKTAASTDVEIREAILTAVPGINRARAQTLLEKFNSIKNIALSDESELKSCPGIGKELAKRLVRILSDDEDNLNA